MVVNYDPLGHGNDLVVTTGHNEIVYSHTTNAPNDFWTAQHDNGEIDAPEFIGEDRVKTILLLE